MENRFENNKEERQEWGAYATPPPILRQDLERLEVQQQPPATLCARVQEMLPSLVENDGTVRPEMAAALFAHLTVCPNCAKEFDEMQRMIAVLNTVPLHPLPMDFTGVIMQRIELEMSGIYAKHDAAPQFGSSFETVQNQTTHKVEFTANTQQSQTTTETFQTQTQSTLVQRVIAMGAFFAALLLFLSSAWGRATLGANIQMAREWVRQIAQATEDVPLLGWVTSEALGVLSQSFHILEETYKTLGATAVKGVFVDIVIVTALYFIFQGRKQNSHKVNRGGH